MRKTEFYKIEETRLEAGFFVREVCENLGISERTWYRWKQKNSAPIWALRAIKLMSGKLDFLGWNGWYIEQGVLYTEKHSLKNYNWTPGQLMVSRFWELNAPR